MNTSLPLSLAPPSFCPFCDTSIIIEGAYPTCPNYYCPRRVYGRVYKFVSLLDIKGAGDDTLLQLCDNKLVKTPADLYQISLDQYATLDRRGEKHYEKFIRGLKEKQLLTTAQFFASMDIEGPLTWEAITKVPGLQTIEQILVKCTQALLSEKDFKVSANFFAKAPRVSLDKASYIIQDVNLKIEDIRSLLKYVKIKEVATKLLGKSFVITGALSQPRSYYEQQIKDLGGTVSNSVTRTIHYIVSNNPDENSTKLNKARMLGFTSKNGKIIDEQKLIEILQEP